MARIKRIYLGREYLHQSSDGFCFQNRHDQDRSDIQLTAKTAVNPGIRLCVRAIESLSCPYTGSGDAHGLVKRSTEGRSDATHSRPTDQQLILSEGQRSCCSSGLLLSSSNRDNSNEAKPVVVKKYANRRLYNTATSSYVTLDDLAKLIKEGGDFVAYDAKTGEDITRSVLTQIIVEQ